MTRVLVTGGTGVLGSALVAQLRGCRVRVMSRRARLETGKLEWVQADLSTGRGLDEALEGVQVLIHAASSPRWRTHAVDVLGTRRILERAKDAGVEYVLYPSIVGIDRIPFSLYRHKLEAEESVRASGIPWTILRGTQFHPFVERFIRAAARLPVVVLPTDFKLQPLDPDEMAARLLRAMEEGPAGDLPPLGGPEVLTLGAMAQDWLELRGVHKPLVRLPLPGRFSAGFRRGDSTVSAGERGTISWREWLLARAKV